MVLYKSYNLYFGNKHLSFIFGTQHRSMSNIHNDVILKGENLESFGIFQLFLKAQRILLTSN